MSKNKVSVLERMGLVRSIEMPEKLEQPAILDEALFETENEKMPSGSVGEIDSDKLMSVEMIYEQTGLSELEDSIFKVGEIADSLPDELSNRQKREITYKLLNTMHLDWEGLITDGQNRVSILLESERKFNEETVSQIDSYKEQISSLEEEIDLIKEKISYRQKQDEAETKIIEDEIDRLNRLLLFMGEGSDLG